MGFIVPPGFNAGLNPEQRAAAESDALVSLILSGPGTGKTTTQVGRYGVLLARGCRPERIFNSTFSARSAAETMARLSKACGLDAALLKRCPVGTMHGLAARLLKRHPPPGLDPDYRIFAADEINRLIARERLYLSDESMKPVDVFSAYKDRLISPEQALERAGNRREEVERATKYAQYQAALAAEGALDFGDLILRLVQAMEADPGYRARIANLFDHILIDEYQDTNLAQERMIKLMRRRDAGLWVVGDDDQSLYGWRSADLGCILDFERRWPNVKIFHLTHNYRSSPSIVAASTAVIRNNVRRHPKALIAVSRQPSPPVLRGHVDDLEEADWIAGYVKAALERGVPAKDIAILYRVGHVAPRIQVALSAAGVPITVRGGGEFWDTPPVRLTTAVLRLTADPRDRDAQTLLGHGKRADKIAQALPDLSLEDGWAALCAVAAALVARTSPPPGEAGGEWRDACETVGDLAAKAGSCAAFVALMADQQRALKQRDRDGQAVVMATLHGAKGLEWPLVILAGCEEHLLPHALNKLPEEERRLMYVGLSRAKHKLVVSYARRRRRAVAPSIYILEMLDALCPERPGADGRVRVTDVETAAVVFDDEATREDLLRRLAINRHPLAPSRRGVSGEQMKMDFAAEVKSLRRTAAPDPAIKRFAKGRVPPKAAPAAKSRDQDHRRGYILDPVICPPGEVTAVINTYLRRYPVATYGTKLYRQREEEGAACLMFERRREPAFGG